MKYVVIVAIYPPCVLIAIVFHRKPLLSGKWSKRRGKEDVHDVLEDPPSMNVEDVTPPSGY